MAVTGTSASENASNVINFTWNMDDVLGLEASDRRRFSRSSIDETPIVTGVSPSTAAVSATVTITGQNFSGAAGQLKVFFGGSFNRDAVTERGRFASHRRGAVWGRER